MGEKKGEKKREKMSTVSYYQSASNLQKEKLNIWAEIAWNLKNWLRTIHVCPFHSPVIIIIYFYYFHSFCPQPYDSPWSYLYLWTFVNRKNSHRLNKLQIFIFGACPKHWRDKLFRLKDLQTLKHLAKQKENYSK